MSTTKGLLLSIAVGAFYQESYGYDSFNRLSTRTVTIDGNAYTTGYSEYNTADQLTKLTYPSGRQITIGHDTRGRVNSVGSHVTGISYNDQGLLSGWTQGNGVVETFGYNNRLQLTSQTATKTGNTLLSLGYSYQGAAGDHGSGTLAGNSGQLISITSTSTINGQLRDEKFKYDHLGRLTSREGWGGGQRRFSFDRWGNRTGSWNSVTAGQQIQSLSLQQSGGAPTNRITSVTNTSGNSVETLTYVYDSAGNVTHDGKHNYKYDAENRVAIVNEGAPEQSTYS